VTRICLASASPRRKELLECVGLELEIVPADIDESVAAGEEPVAYARRLAAHKARRVAERKPGLAVLGADTVVVCDDGGPPILGKPVDAEDARVMLQRLAGRTHQVVTAYHLIAPAGERGRAVETAVTFRALEPLEVQGYVGSREWDGKAGGYAIQGLAAAFVRSVSGSYTNVVGLPLCEVLEDLRALRVLPDDWALG
jgi:septum formation protein